MYVSLTPSQYIERVSPGFVPDGVRKKVRKVTQCTDGFKKRTNRLIDIQIYSHSLSCDVKGNFRLLSNQDTFSKGSLTDNFDLILIRFPVY